MTDDLPPPLDGQDPLDLLAAFASARLMDDDTAEVGAVAFDPGHHGDELADGRTVTGWELFIGNESEDELTDPGQVRLPSLSWVLERFPQLEALFETHDLSDAAWVADEGGTLARVVDGREDEHHDPSPEGA